MTEPRSMVLVMTVPLMGERTSVCSRAMRAFSSATRVRTCSALALAKSRVAPSRSVSLIDCDSNSSSDRRLAAVAFCTRALATSSAAWACSTLFRAVRGSISTISAPRRTTSPVWTLMSVTSPEACERTSMRVSALMLPEACADTMMVRRSTARA